MRVVTEGGEHTYFCFDFFFSQFFFGFYILQVFVFHGSVSFFFSMVSLFFLGSGIFSGRGMGKG